MTDVELVAEDDTWTISHPSVGTRDYDRFGAALEVAQSIAADHGVGVEVNHPTNPNLRRLSA